ncbi:MAG: maleylpyruvate isomerase family mycothiol-dependent enzyme [Actinomycetia bacterium]|nr:maleylpyruvate isomerase family mycothiol-dependent enzyme [Actinomycetes bacterium]
MDVADYIGYVTYEGDRFANAAEKGDLDVAIPACEGWDMRELVRHLGLIHLWAAGNVAFPQNDWFDATDLPGLAHYWPDLGGDWPADADLVAWYRKTLANLIRVLESAPADVECFSFLPAPTPLTMWARRQASEIAIHRYDAEIARGVSGDFEVEFATDMLDEVLAGFAPRPRTLELEDNRTIHVHAEDSGEHWHLTLGPEAITTSRTDAHADLTLAGSASDLYLLLWNRTADSTVSTTGDTDLMNLWRGNFRVQWS